MAIHHGIKNAGKPKLKNEEKYKQIEALLNNGEVHEGTKSMPETVKPKSPTRAKRLSARRKNKSEVKDHKNFACTKCPKLFKTKKYLKKHILNVHEGPKEIQVEESAETIDG